MELDVADEVVGDHVVDVTKHVIIFLLALQNDTVPTIVKRIDHEEQDEKPLNPIPNPTNDPQGQGDETEFPFRKSTKQRRFAISNDYVVFPWK